MNVTERRCILGKNVYFDVLNHEIIGEGKNFVIGSREAAILKILYDNYNKSITKDEFNEKVWGKLWVSETSLTKAISNIRKILNSLDGVYCNIKTIPKEGYMLIMNNEELECFSAEDIIQQSMLSIDKVEINKNFPKEYNTGFKDDMEKKFSRIFWPFMSIIISATLTSLLTVLIFFMLKKVYPPFL